MNRRSFLSAIAAATACATCASLAHAGDATHWGYEGGNGPTRWGATCGTGHRQSPLDIVQPVKAQLPPLTFAYKPIVSEVVNNGHTIQVNVPPGSSMTVGDTVYDLVQFHFHRPSEHLIEGKAFPMEVHFVHKAKDGSLGVCGVLFTEGAGNDSFGAIAAVMPAKESVVKTGLAAINPNMLLPAGRRYFRYSGSLTTPPCSEEVDWYVMTDSVSLSAAQIVAFARLYKMNARPAQKGYKRFVLVSP